MRSPTPNERLGLMQAFLIVLAGIGFFLVTVGWFCLFVLSHTTIEAGVEEPPPAANERSAEHEQAHL